MFERQIERRGLDRVLGLRGASGSASTSSMRATEALMPFTPEALRDHLHDRLLHAASHQEERPATPSKGSRRRTPPWAG